MYLKNCFHSAVSCFQNINFLGQWVEIFNFKVLCEYASADTKLHHNYSTIWMLIAHFEATRERLGDFDTNTKLFHFLLFSKNWIFSCFFFLLISTSNLYNLAIDFRLVSFDMLIPYSPKYTFMRPTQHRPNGPTYYLSTRNEK